MLRVIGCNGKITNAELNLKFKQLKRENQLKNTGKVFLPGKAEK